MDQLLFCSLSTLTIKASVNIGSIESASPGCDFQRYVDVFNAHSIPNSVQHRAVSILVFGSFGNGKSAPIRLTKKEFASLFGALRLPRQFLQGVLGNNGSLAHFVEYESNSPFRPCYMSVLVNTPHGPRHDFSIAIRVEITSGKVLALYLDKQEALLDKTMTEFDEQCQRADSSPLDFLVLLLAEYGRSNEEWRSYLDHRVVSMETRTGMTSLFINRVHNADEDGNLYEELTRGLHACNTEETFDLFEKLRQERSMVPFHDKRARCSFQQHLDWIVNLSRQRQHQAMSLKTRVQSQINLLYSLISQRDSRVNLMVAESSKQIAEDARRDSRSMKTIALVTLIFLPGTLIASIFSTGMINLNPSYGEKITAPYWWILVLVMLVLTGLVLLTWLLWNRTYVHKVR